MKRVLIVSPHFPPVNAPDMQRVRQSLPHFVAAGWEVTVLTVADPTPDAPVEPELLRSVPAAVRIVRARCLARTWTVHLGIGNVAPARPAVPFYRRPAPPDGAAGMMSSIFPPPCSACCPSAGCGARSPECPT
ncbi:MAG: hypothetical protein WDM96_04255 [Lacunisphaera sp.]